MKTTKLNSALIGCATIIGSIASFQAMADETNRNPADKTYTGIVTAVAQPDHSLSVKGWLVTKHFNLGNACAFTLPDKSNGSLNDLRSGEDVVVYYQDVKGVLIADRIEQKPMRLEGRVTGVDPDAHTLAVHRTGSTKDMIIGDNCRVVLAGGAAGKFSDVQVGDLVTVTYETPGKQTVACEIDQNNVNYVGNVTAIDLGARTIRAKALMDSKSFNLADDCAIVVNGRTDAKLSDLRPNERLVFSYQAVNGVNVVNKIAMASSQNTANTATGNTGAGTNNYIGFAPPSP